MSFLGFGSKKSKQKTKETQDATKNTSSTTDSSMKSGKNSIIDSLSSTAIKAGTDFLTGLIKDAGAPDSLESQTKDLASMLISRAAGAEDALLAQGDAIFSEARRIGQDKLNRLQTDFAQQAGGTTGNSFVAGATAQGTADLESELASGQATFDISARNTATQEMLTAIQGGTAAANEDNSIGSTVASLIYALKGAKTVAKETDRQTGSTETTGVDKLHSDLEGLIKGKNSSFDLGFGKS